MLQKHDDFNLLLQENGLVKIARVNDLSRIYKYQRFLKGQRHW